jgi:hypothetical protein
MEAYTVVRRRGSYMFQKIRFTEGGEVCEPYVPAALYLQEDSWNQFLLDKYAF